MTKQHDLFDAIVIGDCTLPNRIVMAPMTRNRAGEGNVPQPLNVTYYQQRASAGLIITEGSQISPEGVGYPATPGIHNDVQVEGWKAVTRAVHDRGGHIFLQLWHVGRISHPSLQPDGHVPVAPSAIKPDGEAATYDGMQPFVRPRELMNVELPAIVADYVNAARKAMQAGFDGVEIHAANGYLLDQFIRDGSNQRDDDYGGSIKNRIRLLREVVEAVCKAIGSKKVGVRISPENSFNSMHDSDPQNTFNAVTDMLNSFNLAYLHVLEGDMMNGNHALDYKQIKSRFAGPYMANCGYDFERATQAVKTGSADLVSFGIPFISNPDLVERLKTGAELNPADATTFYGGDEKGYTDYPFL
ncbi:MAG: alkene reductase [Gammaproteobacteria bacterium]|nr:alkene reductase [Gammaproteobacteria bacterium]MCW8923842.1 alkene reductase [Gammaproteobacteria bacterium]